MAGKIKEFNLNITSIEVTAKPRKLKCDWGFGIVSAIPKSNNGVWLSRLIHGSQAVRDLRTLWRENSRDSQKRLECGKVLSVGL